MSIDQQQEKRQRWPSRLSFVLASMGAAVGIGNLLRYPSIAARHYGLQWFIPYFLALFLIGIPMLALEIALGQTMRGAAMVANNAVHRRLRGMGIISPFALVTKSSYVILMAWVLAFLRHSFTRPLPWLANPNFFAESVVRNFESVQRAPGAFFSYPRLGIVGETLGWTLLTWVLVYFSLFLGIGLTGRVVYFTMLVPLALCIALLARALSLPRAINGVRLYAGVWRSDVLASGAVWRDAIVQIFFSLGTGFGAFTAYSSYNSASSNAMQDVLIIGLSNSLFEVVIGFAAFAIVGFREIDLSKVKISTFELGFITYPAALARIPGGNVWCVFFFLTVYLLAVDSAFAMLESVIAVFTDSDRGRRLPKPLSVGIISVIGLCSSIPYTTEFGSALLNAMDFWIAGITVSFATWFHCVTITGIYRYKDVISQTGRFAFVTAQTAYVSSMVFGVIIGSFLGFSWGILSAAAILAIGTFQAMALSDTPEIIGSFGSNISLNKLWWLTSYSVRTNLSSLTRFCSELLLMI